MNPAYFSATGNRFAVFDGFAQNVPRQEAALSLLARRCSTVAEDTIVSEAPWEPDGMIVISPPAEPGPIDYAFSYFNRDGSRAEMCGNGLRAAAALAWHRGYAASRQKVRTDVGLRRTDVLSQDGRSFDVRAEVGTVRVLNTLSTLPLRDESLELSLVHAGNPHAVLWVADEREVDVERLGPAVERHPEFPQRTNVGFVAVRDDVVRLRVWERGVGETRACGTGACAAAAVLRERGGRAFPMKIAMQGGTLEVESTGAEFFLRGGVVQR